ncbi:MAG: polysaccharide deacetylase family protein [Treponema sp.]|nr:polysaccharide deacetylase family protein [Treponema sp.]
MNRQAAAFPRGAVLFTFDDGPNRRGDTTERLLEVLRRYGIRACFALLGENAEHSPHLVRLIRDEGHLIINHGYGDRFTLFLKTGDFVRSLEAGEEAIIRALGVPYTPKYFRPQGGIFRDHHRTAWEARGYRMIPVTARAYDAVLKESERPLVIRRLVSAVEKDRGGVILLHDGRDSQLLMESRLQRNPRGPFNRSWIPAAVEELILSFQTRGYQLTGFHWDALS